MSEQRSTVLVVAVGVVIGLLIAILVFLAFAALGGDDEVSSETTVPSTTTSAEPTTTAGPTTSTSETTSTTTQAPTTTEVATTTTTEPPTSTSTAVVVPLVLEPNGIGGVDFGAAPDVAIAYATLSLGPPDRDTGWVDSFSEFGTCPPPEVRGVQWGTSPTGFAKAFTLLFTKAATSHAPAGGEHLFGYDYYGGDVELATPEGLTVGSTLAEARSAYPTIDINESPWDPTAGTWVVDDDREDDAQLFGYATGQADTDLVTSILGGVTCGE